MKRCQAAKQGLFGNLRDSRCSRSATHGCFCWQHKETGDDDITSLLIGKKWDGPERRATHKIHKQIVKQLTSRSPWTDILSGGVFPAEIKSSA